jgi:hypothetical protein
MLSHDEPDDSTAPFERIIAAASGYLSREQIDQILSYLRHGEDGLAFEGLVSSLRRSQFTASPDILRDLAYLAENLRLEDYPDGKGVYW